MCVADREETRDAYTSIGDALACIHQLIDDVSDLFGAAPSADLRTGTWTAPIAFVYESLTADERVQWVARLEERSAATQVEVCRRAYETGAMHRVATVLARERERFLGALGTVATNSPYAAMLMAWLDDLVGLVHRPCRAPERLDILAVEATDLAPADLEIYQRLREARTQTLARISDSVQA
jgi:geranylgeranyl pyrophosphate synthase